MHTEGGVSSELLSRRPCCLEESRKEETKKVLDDAPDNVSAREAPAFQMAQLAMSFIAVHYGIHNLT